MPPGSWVSKNEFHVEKNEPKLQINCAYPIANAALRSVTIGEISAIIAAKIPMKLKRIRSIKILGFGKVNRRIRCNRSKPIAICLINSLGRILKF